jgi:photosystem II stability/assembly factor-like uncharacterized protein
MPKTSVLVLSAGLAVFLCAPAARSVTWRSIGPDGGGVLALAFAPSDPHVAYAGTQGGGVFRSDDGGASWTAASGGLDILVIQSLAVDPRDPAVVYAGTPIGLYETTSGGASWRALPLRSPALPPAAVTAVRIDSAHPRVLYAVTSAGVFRTADGGAHWTERDAGLPLDRSQERLVALDLDPDHPGTLYAGFFNSDFSSSPVPPPLYETTDGGGRWIAVTSLQTFQVYALARHRPTNSLYASTDAGLFVTHDGGATWTSLFPDTFLNLAVAPSGALYGYPFFLGVYSSVDGGRTWNDPAPSSPDRPYGEAAVLALDPQGNRLLASTDANLYALDTGGGWKLANRGLRATDVTGLAVTSTSLLAAATLGGGVFVSADGGASFVARDSGIPVNSFSRDIDVASLAVDPRVPGSLAVGLFSGAVARTSNNGRRWTSETPLCLLPADRLALASPATIFVASSSAFSGGSCAPAACSAGVSRDGGASFACLDGPPDVSAFLVDPLRPAVIYAAAGDALWKSTDRGARFTLVASHLGMTVTGLASSPAAHQTLYASGSLGGLKSTDGGATWSPVGPGPGGRIVPLVVDPMNPSLVYAIGALVGPLILGQAVFESHDGGASWSRLGDGLPAGVDPSALALDSARHVLYVGTLGSGVWALSLL